MLYDYTTGITYLTIEEGADEVIQHLTPIYYQRRIKNVCPLTGISRRLDVGAHRRRVKKHDELLLKEKIEAEKAARHGGLDR